MIEHSMLVASDEATAGSVMAKPERISPASSGCNQRSCCSGVAYFINTSILPVSGALQLNTSGDHSTRPINSASGAYSRLLSPAPPCFSCSLGINRFQSPSSLARAFNSAMIGGVVHRLSAASSCSRCRDSTGKIWRCMNSSSCDASVLTRSVTSKCISCFRQME